MTTSTKARATVSTVSALTGKRLAAFASIASLSFAEDKGRAASLANMRVVLGSSPSMDETKAAKRQWIVGRVASRLPAACLPRGCKTDEARLAFALSLVTEYAKPAVEGSKAKLRKGQKGYRTASQQRFVRAAEEACSVFFAELGLSNAQTTAQRDAAKATRAPSMAGSGKGKPSHAELVKPEAPHTEETAINHLMTQGALLLQFTNKNAKLIPTAVGMAVQQFKSALNKAANEAAEARAAAAAKTK